MAILDQKMETSAEARQSFADIIQRADNWAVLWVLVIVTLSTSIGSAVTNLDGADRLWWSGWLQNFSTEMMGAIATFFLFELIIEARKRRDDKQDQIDKEKQNLIIQMRSKDNATALNAVEQLRANGWLDDGTLANAFLPDGNLSFANLQRADLAGAYISLANLSHASLSRANLSGSGLGFSDLSGAYLSKANLSKAKLFRTTLIGTHFSEANLTSANIRESNLSGANLSQANLSGALFDDAILKHVNMSGVECDENTILPDGSRWTPDTDWTQFGAVEIEDFQEWKAYRQEHGLDEK